MKKNCKGFTLVELMISVLIFGVVSAAIFGFMLTGAKTYNTVTDRISQQTQAQMAVNQLGDCLIDCNEGVYFDTTSNPPSKTLYIINVTMEKKTGDKDTYVPNYKAHVFKFEKSEIRYGNLGITKNTDGSFSCQGKVDELLTDDVSDFSVKFKGDEKLTKCDSATVSVKLKNRTLETVNTRTFAFRNKPAKVTVS
ncbi:MAG: prepilin-type N-terminal cleavage/methylation domain-containing protein [Oscillospiraceae bacterium]